MSQTEDPNGEAPEHEQSFFERLRGTGVGMEDPNISGDAGLTDLAPGHDPDLPPLTEELPPEEETPSERALPSEPLPNEVVGPDGQLEIVELVEVIDGPGTGET